MCRSARADAADRLAATLATLPIEWVQHVVDYAVSMSIEQNEGDICECGHPAVVHEGWESFDCNVRHCECGGYRRK